MEGVLTQHDVGLYTRMGKMLYRAHLAVGGEVLDRVPPSPDYIQVVKNHYFGKWDSQKVFDQAMVVYERAMQKRQEFNQRCATLACGRN